MRVRRINARGAPHVHGFLAAKVAGPLLAQRTNARAATGAARRPGSRHAPQPTNGPEPTWARSLTPS